MKYAPKPNTCDGCPWQHLDNGYAAGCGPSNARLAVVAESAGTNEAIQGVPLVGWTGSKLNEFFANHGINRREVYMDNVVRCMPPAGKKAKLPKEVIAFCTERHLRPALELIKPNAVLALGDYSLKYLTGNTSISKYRGSLLLTNFTDSRIKCVPTFHPSYLVKGNDAAIMWPFVDYDIGKAIRESQTPSYTPVTENFNVNPSIEDLRTFLEIARADGSCSIDIETSAGSWWNTAILCIGMYSHDRAISFPLLGHRGAHIWNTTDLVEIIELLGDFLADGNVRKILQNGNYDIQVLESYGFTVANFWFDTMIAHHVVVSEKGVPHDLGFIASTYTDVPFYKDDVKGEDNFALLDPFRMRTYNCRDTLVTHTAAPELDKEIDEYGVRSTFEQDMRMLLPMRNVQKRGVLIDTALLHRYRRQLDDDIGSAIATLKATFGEDFISLTKSGRPTVTPVRLRRLLFDDLKLQPTGFSKKTRLPLTDFDALLSLTDQAGADIEPILRILLIWRKLDKLRSTYFDDFILDDNSRLHTSYTIHITPTGRLSSRGPNLQNIPDGMAKEIFVARPGFVLLERDYSQIELRILAEVAGDEILRETFATGGDVHTQNASDLFNILASQVVKDQRDFAKTFVYGGIIYGGTASTIRRQALSKLLRKKKPGDPDVYIPSVREIETCQANYLHKHHWVRDYQTGIEREVRKERRLRAPLGRVRIFLGKVEDMIRAAYNFPIQGTAADIMNPAFIELDRVLTEDEAGIVLQVHDSFVFEVPEQQIEKYLDLTKAIMEKPVTLNGNTVQFPTDAKIGYSWGKMEKVTG